MTPEDPPPASLAELIDFEVEPRRVWRTDELGALLLHELSLPLPVGLSELRLAAGGRAGDAAADAEGVKTASALGLATVGELLHHDGPPLDLLVRVKDYAKAARHDPGSHLPEGVAAVLYAMAIAAALVRHGQRITSMDEALSLSNLRWAADRPWLDAVNRGLILEALRQLERERPPDRPLL